MIQFKPNTQGGSWSISTSQCRSLLKAEDKALNFIHRGGGRVDHFVHSRRKEQKELARCAVFVAAARWFPVSIARIIADARLAAIDDELAQCDFVFPKEMAAKCSHCLKEGRDKRHGFAARFC